MAQHDGFPEDWKWFASDWTRDWYRDICTPHGGVFGKSQLKLIFHVCKVHFSLFLRDFKFGLLQINLQNYFFHGNLIAMAKDCSVLNTLISLNLFTGIIFKSIWSVICLWEFRVYIHWQWITFCSVQIKWAPFQYLSFLHKIPYKNSYLKW